MNGDVIGFETRVGAHPVNEWLGPVRGRRNGFVHGYSGCGVFVHKWERMRRDWLGMHVPVTFEIYDKRARDGRRGRDSLETYLVTISDGTGRGRGKGGGRVLLKKEYGSPGVYTEFVKLAEPKWATLVVGMETKQGLYYEHAVVVGYNVEFDRGVVWLVSVPALIFGVVFLLYGKELGPAGGGGRSDDSFLR